MQSITITINDLKDKSTPEIQVEAFDIQYKKLDEEFEETIRGDLMNLKLVKKYLDKVKPTAKTKDEYLKAMNIIDKDILNLEKFVNERWGE